MNAKFIKNLNRNLFNNIPKKGYKMQQLHFYTGGGSSTPSGIKVCIFGSTSNMGSKIAADLLPKGCPMVFVHRNPLDIFCPVGDDTLFTKSNPYHTMPDLVFQPDLVSNSLVQTRVYSELGMRYYQYCVDLTNEFDIENGIKDCDVVINLIGQKPVVRYDHDYEEPNIIIPREIAKVCAKKMKEGKLKKFIHFSAAGANPDAISRRLRTKWQGEQDVHKYFPEATIVRPTTIISDDNSSNFISYYLHCWNNNNGTVLLLDDGKCIRQPVLDWDISQAVFNILQLDESMGQIYELGGTHSYTMRELIEFFSNSLRHRPRYVSTSYDEFMKTSLSPNWNFEKTINWLITRPDYSAELRTDIIVNKRDGVKTFEDLFITPVAPHHFLTDLGNWFLERLNVESAKVRNHDEYDADDDAHL